MLSYFTSDFGEVICPLEAVIPDDNPLDPKDIKNLRYSYRTNGKSGFVFVNNYVRHQKMAEHKNISLKTPDGNDVIATVDIKNGDFFFFPFNIELGGVKIKSARATPLCLIDGDDGKKIVFYKREGETLTANELFDLENPSDIKKIILLSRQEALNAWKIIDKNGKTNIFISNDNEYVYQKNGDAILVSRESGEPSEDDVSSDVIIKINYIGESARIYETLENGKNKLIFDHFFIGEDYPWEISLKALARNVKDLSKLFLDITPLKKGDDIYIEKWPDFDGKDEIVQLRSVEYETEYATIINRH